MALQVDDKFIAGRAWILVADPFTPAPDYKTLNPNQITGGFESIGEISADNIFNLAKEGGDKTTKRTHANAAARVVVAPTTYTLNMNSLSINAKTFDLAFNGALDSTKDKYTIKSGASLTNKAVFVLMQDGVNRQALYFSNASIGLGDVQSFGLGDFTEIPLTASILEDELTGDIFDWYAPGFGSGVAVRDAEALTTVAGGEVADVEVIDGGTGYTSAPAVAFVGGGATTAATGTAAVANGRVVSVTVTDPGAGYTADPEVTFTR
jgi:hypothetical protein